MSRLESMLSRLPHIYTNDINSNIGKLAQVYAEQLDEIDTVFQTIKDYRDIDKAIGATLDRIGVNVQQDRGAVIDNVYRILLKVKIKRNLSDGKIDTLIDIFSFMLQTAPDKIQITEEYPAGMHMDLPPEALNTTGLTFKQIGQIANLVAAGGVGISVLFEGTFQFSSQATVSEYDDTTSFGDEAGTVGGYFGAVYDPNEEVSLPI